MNCYFCDKKACVKVHHTIEADKTWQENCVCDFYLCADCLNGFLQNKIKFPEFS